MAVPRRVHVKGPLAPYAAGFVEVLVRQGYRSATDHLYMMAQLSRWLLIEEREPADLTAAGSRTSLVGGAPAATSARCRQPGCPNWSTTS